MSDKHKRATSKAATEGHGAQESLKIEHSLNALFERIRAEYPSIFGSPTIKSLFLNMGSVEREHGECVDMSTQPTAVHSAFYKQLCQPGTLIYVIGAGGSAQTFLMSVPVVAEDAPAEAESALDSAVKECTEAVTQTHEQIERNRDEIERLGEETRNLISKMLAA